MLFANGFVVVINTVDFTKQSIRLRYVPRTSPLADKPIRRCEARHLLLPECFQLRYNGRFCDVSTTSGCRLANCVCFGMKPRRVFANLFILAETQLFEIGNIYFRLSLSAIILLYEAAQLIIDIASFSEQSLL